MNVLRFIVCLFISVFIIRSGVFAQTPPPIPDLSGKGLNLAQTLLINDAESVDGDIMSLSDVDETLVRAAKDYDERMYGVLNVSPVMVYRTRDTIPVARAGLAMVNVTTMSGPITVGDYITSSAIAGKGQKAAGLTGYMVGVAIGSFDGTGGTQVEYEGRQLQAGKVNVAIGIGPASPAVIKASGGIFGTLRSLVQALLFNIGQADKWLRYLLAAIIILITIIVGFRTFGRNITKGIEAIGRNPLARASIQAMIILNVVMILVVVIGGVILSLVIISL